MTATDSRGKIIRVGDSVHKETDVRTVRKKVANGRVLPPLKVRTVQAIHTIHGNPVVFLHHKKPGLFGSELIKK